MVKLEKTGWIDAENSELLCFNCGSKKASLRMTYSEKMPYGDMRVNVCLCDICARLPVVEIMRAVQMGRREKEI